MQSKHKIAELKNNATFVLKSNSINWKKRDEVWIRMMIHDTIRLSYLYIDKFKPSII